MSVYLSPNARQQFFDANGNPLVGGKLYTYQSGTTTPQATYTDYTGAYAHTNPVILDSRGEAEVYWLNSLYTVVLKDADDNVVYTQDGVAPAFASGNLVYKGTWNAATNTPSLASGIGTTGDYYVVSVAGTTSLDGVASWAVGDWAVFGTTAWQKTPMGTTYGSAVNTTYDNTTSGLTATNVQAAIDEVVDEKQDVLESGVSIKTVNTNSLLGSGDISVQPVLESGTNIKTINSTSLLGSGNITIDSGVTTLNGETGAITNTGLGNIGSYAVLMYAGTSNIAQGSTVAGSDLRYGYTVSSSGYVDSIAVLVPYLTYYANGLGYYLGGGTALTGTWRKMSNGASYASSGSYYWLPGLYVRIA